MSPHEEDLRRLLHSRQFICGSRDVEVPGLPRAEVFAGLALRVHRDLIVTTARHDDRELLCLGHLLDPSDPHLDNSEVLTGVLRVFDSFESLEKSTAVLGGRWLLFARLGGERRLYPDAAGTRSAFHAMLPSGLWVASQPGLIAAESGSEVDKPDWSPRSIMPPGATSWPCAATPFKGVRQLLPNSFLDLETGVTHRFWPTRPVPRLELEAAAGTVARLLTGSIAAAMSRGSVAIPLTGGLDSRTLFACAGKSRHRIRFFSVAGFHSARYDRSIPRRIGRMFGVDVRIVRPRPHPPGFGALIERNTAGMWWDPADYLVYSFSAADSRFILFGLLAEIARCFYYPDGRHPAKVTPDLLADVAHFGDHPVAMAALREWLATVPMNSEVATLDLFYWEHRAGNWVSMTCTAYDAVADILAPYNCRALLEAALGVDPVHRAYPHALHRRVCTLAEPEIMSVPVNASRLDQLCSSLSRLIPWRIRNALHRLRMQMAGF